MNYWDKRLSKQQDRIAGKTEAEARKQLSEYYSQAAKDICSDIEKVYEKIIKDASTGEVAVNDLYRFNRLFELNAKVNKNLKGLGAAEILIEKESLIACYNATASLVADAFGILKPENAEAVLNSVWCADGKLWSNRVWKNQQQLQKAIEKGLIDSVARGLPKDEAIKEIMRTMESGFNNANRIMRTELTNVQTQASVETYKKAGIEKYKFVAADDERTSQICDELDGKIFNMAEGKVGVNMPPMHPYCRSTIIPIIERTKANVQNRRSR